MVRVPSAGRPLNALPASLGAAAVLSSVQRPGAPTQTLPRVSEERTALADLPLLSLLPLLSPALAEPRTTEAISGPGVPWAVTLLALHRAAMEAPRVSPPGLSEDLQAATEETHWVSRPTGSVVLLASPSALEEPRQNPTMADLLGSKA